ncbi:MAG: hypothetical protein ACKKMV_00280 [Candidatus Nealsonbacteria bacterium]
MRNTKKKGKFTIFTYPQKPNYFIGVCLEFDLITEGQTLVEAKENIFRASVSYLQTIIKNNLSDKLLNFPPDPKYLKEYTKLLKKRVRMIEKVKKEKRQKEKKLIPWEEYFSFQDVPYNPDFFKKLKKEKVCV